MRDLDRAVPLIERYVPGCRIIASRRLRGGLGSRMDRLRIEDGDGNRTAVVLRRYLPGWPKSTAEVARFEFAVLQFLDRAGLPGPRALALDAEGECFDTPAMLLSYLPGRSFFKPRDVSRWTRELAEALARVHRVNPQNTDLGWLPGDGETDIGQEIEERRVQMDGLPAIATRAFVCLDDTKSRVTWQNCLIHDDFWPGNTVWSRGHLAGIIDWSDAKIGDPRGDVAQCRTDLIISHGTATADAFLEAYSRFHAPGLEEMAFFDLLRGLRALVYYKHWLVGYRDAGVTDVSEVVVEGRLRDFLERALDQWAATQAGSRGSRSS